MEIHQVDDSDKIRPLHVALLALLLIAVGGGFFLLSAAESTESIDGAIEWHTQSLLRAVVRLLCMNYAHPTLHQGAIKVYLLGLGAGLAAIVLGISLLAHHPGDSAPRGSAQSASRSDHPVVLPHADPKAARTRSTAHVSPALAAQAMFALYVLWSFASSRWSHAPAIAVGASVLLALHTLWPLCLGNGLNRSAARIGGILLLGIASATAVIAIWYFHGRNPTLRAKFPFGNPTFLSAALIPGAILAASLATQRLIQAARTRSARSAATVLPALAALAALAVIGYAMILCDSRGPAVGLAFGLLASLFFAVRGWKKLLPIGMALTLTVLGLGAVARMADRPSDTGRDSTIRLRFHAAQYALDLFGDQPLNGHGQGAYVCLADALSVEDVLDDPEPFTARITHAHNEWLEVLCDLGAVGLALVFSGLALTLQAGHLTLTRTVAPGQRWLLIALLGALVGLVVEECTGVGLRVSGVGTVYYTVIGLIWALCRPAARSTRVARTGGVRARSVLAALAIAVGICGLMVNQSDFESARAAFSVQGWLNAGHYEEAIATAEKSRNRLNPQRALIGEYRVASTYLLAAQALQARGQDRQTRAERGVPNAEPLTALALSDYEQSYAYCVAASEALASLVQSSPAFLNHGRLEYTLNLTTASLPTSEMAKAQFVGAAQLAIDRELKRQPYNPAIAMARARLAVDSDEAASLIVMLARPLRYDRIAPAYVTLFAELFADVRMEAGLTEALEQIKQSDPVFAGSPDDGRRSLARWAPEVLRIGATVEFMRGNYEAAVLLLTDAASRYEKLALGTSIGMASCYAELANALFYRSPEDLAPAIQRAHQAMSACPDSLPGRSLREIVLMQEVNYRLASEDEERAVEILRETAKTAVSREVIEAELANRYRRLCESVLDRRQAHVLRQAPSGAFPKLIRWIQRSIALDPDNPLSHFIAADLVFHGGDDVSAVAYLREALTLRMDPAAVLQFVEMAVAQRPRSEAMAILRGELKEAVERMRSGEVIGERP